MSDEYPKVLYLKDDVEDYVIVEDEKGEAAAKKDGYVALTIKPVAPKPAAASDDE